ncbi:MAG TPA: ABC transporter substrate-binding protein [Vicinamibacteria bacterium]|nr:ABC transporter substrate-binding protein [Vicinamibacteria bacterium]
MRCLSIVRAARRPLAVLLCGAVLDCTPRASGQGERSLQVLTAEIPQRLDPYEDHRLTNVQISENVFEPLVRMRAGPAPEPGLAESWHSPSPDETVFRLREGIRFHDGAPLDGPAVVESLERARRSRSVSGHFGDVAEIRALDARTVSMHTRAPVAVLVYGLTGVPIIRETRAGLAGTGPYRVETFVPGQSVRLVRYRDYVGPQPYLDDVVFRRYEGDEQALALLRAWPRSLLSPASASVAAQMSADPRARVVTRATRVLHYLAFGLDPRDASPVRDRDVRRAVRAALDVPALIGEASPAGGEPASQLVPPGTVGFDPGLRVPPRDLDAARSLLTAAGYPQGLDLELDVRGKDAGLAAAVARQLADAGVRVHPREWSVEDFARRIEGASTFFLYNWVPGQESGAGLRNFLHTRDPYRSLGLQNRTGYSNVEVDYLLEQSGLPASPSERVALQQRAMALLMKDLPWIPLFIPNEQVVEPRDLEIPMRLDETVPLAEVRPLAVDR